ncbi:5'-methylthioadenosine/S-adenosylhomocysteine nucleosidase [Allonocardiopsis opalescens]|uniref:Nucleoside phosphorylase n=1 Tax=Allonocardiopsis opalescens TaxID=1144618 RepID=A0A2T0PYR2_9ACTN|nr:5'-methylthioadenosine/S-adenosylhomocysteine nucleosidase [Allonocardiopsis opalescens]PRX96599.1 nucleoside phosphorylase [Allonocardiopsis opalescens]
MTLSAEQAGTVVLLTPLELEYRAMRAFVTELEEYPHSRGTLFEVGRISGVPWRVALAATGEGNRPAAVLAERAIDTFDPVAVLVVGIAGGLKSDIRLGDVVVSSWVYAYGGGKEDQAGFHASPRAWPSAHRLTEAARAVSRNDDWAASQAGSAAPAVHFKPIAAGEIVLNSRVTPLAQQLNTFYRDAVAIEMESAGVADAAHLNDDLPLLTIRGISDLADGEKHLSDEAGLQPIAASHAAAFAAALLRKLAGVLPVKVRPETPRMVQEIVGAPGNTLNVVQHGNLYVNERPAAQPSSDTAAPVAENGTVWRPLAEALTTTWCSQFTSRRGRASASLELHLVPADQTARLEVRRLAALNGELAALGRTQKLFDSMEALSTDDLAVVTSESGSGLAVTRGGQRSAWQPLPKDGLGAVLDPADLAERLEFLLNVLLQINVFSPVEVGCAVGITEPLLVAEGRVSDLPRHTARVRPSTAPVRVAADDVVPLTCITADAGGIAEELCARLMQEFRMELR